MNLRDLEYIVALAEYQHFGKAARACHISQPTLSAQLNKLENTLGIKLFERTNKTVMISPVGEPIINQARAIIHAVSELKTLAKLAKDPTSGQFRLATVPTLGPYLLPLTLPHVKKSLPKLELLLFEDKTEVIVDQLKQGKLDAILLPLPINEPGLITSSLFSEPFVLGLSKHHSLENKKRITIDTLKDEKLLLLEEGHCLRNQVLEVCTLSDMQKEADYQATSLEMLRQMIVLDNGVSLFPLLATANDRALCFRPFHNKKNYRDIGLVWRGLNPRQSICQTISRIIEDKVPSHLAKLQEKIT